MVVQHNLTAMNSNRMLNITVKSQSKSTEKLSSGYKINRAADDAAGLSISEKMRKQIRGLTQASSNAQDGISMVQTAEGALNEVQDMLQRANELAVKASNGTLSDDDRNYIKNEIDQLNTEIDRVRTTSKFNETYLFPNSENAVASPLTMANEIPEGAEVIGRYTISYDTSTEDIHVVSYGDAGKAVVVKDDGSTEATTILAERIANEFVPNAISQILSTFPSLDVGAGVDIDLVLYKDAKGGVLAFAQLDKGVFSINVDTEDFDDDDALGTGSAASMLESTLAHELTHTIMQNKYISHMAGAGKDFPKWFKEGAADLSGGGFSAGHNSWLKVMMSGISDPDDTSKDTEIAAKFTTAANKLKLSDSDAAEAADTTNVGATYGTGFLATAYMGYLAAGGTGAVTAEKIAEGVDKIFARLNAGDSFADAINNATGGTTLADIYTKVDGADPDFVTFVRKLAVAAGPNGAASMIAGGLDVGGTDILKDNATQQKYKINGKYMIDTGLPDPAGSLNLHVGADATSNNQIQVKLFDIGAKSLGTSTVDFTSQEGATKAIDKISVALQRVSSIRSYYGSIQNRLDHTINNLDNVVENTTSAESAIRDTDMATEMVRYSNNNILAQAGQAMLAQSNQSNQGVLSLLQ